MGSLKYWYRDILKPTRKMRKSKEFHLRIQLKVIFTFQFLIQNLKFTKDINNQTKKMKKNIYKASNTYDSYPCRYVPIIIDLSASESHQVVSGPSQGGTGTGISL